MNRKDLQYQDDWAYGWMSHRSGDKLQYAKKIAKEDEAFYVRIGFPEQITTGLVDGWNARAEAVKLLEKGEVTK